MIAWKIGNALSAPNNIWSPYIEWCMAYTNRYYVTYDSSDGIGSEFTVF